MPSDPRRHTIGVPSSSSSIPFDGGPSRNSLKKSISTPTAPTPVSSSSRSPLLASSRSNIGVFARIRPLNAKEKALGNRLGSKCLQRINEGQSIIVGGSENADSLSSNSPDGDAASVDFSDLQDRLTFHYEKGCTFDENVTQDEVFKKAAQPIVDDVMQGINGTVFAYGQTSSGKTYTMEGPTDWEEVLNAFQTLSEEGLSSGGSDDERITTKANKTNNESTNSSTDQKNAEIIHPSSMSLLSGQQSSGVASVLSTSNVSVSSDGTYGENTSGPSVENDSTGKPSMSQNQKKFQEAREVIDKFWQNCGIIGRAVRHIFQCIDERSGGGQHDGQGPNSGKTSKSQQHSAAQFVLKMSVVEIYRERIRDLLEPHSKRKIRVAETSNAALYGNNTKRTYLAGAAEKFVHSPADVFQNMLNASCARSTAATLMNDYSSRSHCVVIIKVAQRTTTTTMTTTTSQPRMRGTPQSATRSTGCIKEGTLFLVDLAGSEKVRKTGASGVRLEEAKKINQSLSALGNVIKALTSSTRSHVPYRDSKLTRLLTDSLGGTARTALIVCVSPALRNVHETISTLRFGDRAKRVKNRPVVNQQLSVAELHARLKAARKEIETLKAQLSSSPLKGSSSSRISSVAKEDIQTDTTEEKKGNDPKEKDKTKNEMEELIQKEREKMEREKQRMEKIIREAEENARKANERVGELELERKQETDRSANENASLQVIIAKLQAEVSSLQHDEKLRQSEHRELRQEQSKREEIETVLRKTKRDLALEQQNVECMRKTNELLKIELRDEQEMKNACQQEIDILKKAQADHMMALRKNATSPKKNYTNNETNGGTKGKAGTESNTISHADMARLEIDTDPLGQQELIVTLTQKLDVEGERYQILKESHEALISQLEKMSSQLSQEFSQSAQEKKQLTIQLHDRVEKVANLASTLDNVRDTVELRESEVNKLKAEKDSLMAQVKKYASNTSRLHRQIATLQKEKMRLEDTIWARGFQVLDDPEACEDEEDNTYGSEEGDIDIASAFEVVDFHHDQMDQIGMAKGFGGGDERKGRKRGKSKTNWFVNWFNKVR